MGLRLSFGFGPLRASVPLTGKKRRKAARTYQGTLKLANGKKWKCSHRHQTNEAAVACANRHAKQLRA